MQDWAGETRRVSGFGWSMPDQADHLGLSGRCSVWEGKPGSNQMKPPEDFDLSWLSDLSLLTRDWAQYEVNVLQVKVKSQGSYFAWGGLKNRRTMEFHQFDKNLHKNVSTTPWRHLLQEHSYCLYNKTWHFFSFNSKKGIDCILIVLSSGSL